VLVTFWATWCGPCRKEIPNIRENFEKYRDQGFDVIAVSIDDDLGELKEFVAQQELPWTVVADNHPKNRDSMGEKYGVRSIPTLVLVNKEGKVATLNSRGERLSREIDRLMSGT
jgi:thiol-disulfide isomerase/thioredoxin